MLHLGRIVRVHGKDELEVTAATSELWLEIAAHSILPDAGLLRYLVHSVDEILGLVHGGLEIDGPVSAKGPVSPVVFRGLRCGSVPVPALLRTGENIRVQKHVQQRVPRQ